MAHLEDFEEKLIECFYSHDGYRLKYSVGIGINLRVLGLVLASSFFNDPQPYSVHLLHAIMFVFAGQSKTYMGRGTSHVRNDTESEQ